MYGVGDRTWYVVVWHGAGVLGVQVRPGQPRHPQQAAGGGVRKDLVLRPQRCPVLQPLYARPGLPWITKDWQRKKLCGEQLLYKVIDWFVAWLFFLRLSKCTIQSVTNNCKLFFSKISAELYITTAVMAVSKTCVDLDSYQSKQLCGIWRQIYFEMFFGSFCIRPKCIVSKMIRCLSGFSTFYPWMIYRKRKRKSIRSLLYRKNRLKYSEGISWKMRNSTLHPSKFVLSWKLNVNEYLRVNRCLTSTSTAQRKYYFWWYWSSTSLFFY